MLKKKLLWRWCNRLHIRCNQLPLFLFLKFLAVVTDYRYEISIFSVLWCCNLYPYPTVLCVKAKWNPHLLIMKIFSSLITLSLITILSLSPTPHLISPSLINLVVPSFNKTHIIVRAKVRTLMLTFNLDKHIIKTTKQQQWRNHEKSWDDNWKLSIDKDMILNQIRTRNTIS